MAAQTGTFVDDARLRPRDNSGGPKGPKDVSDFGEAGKPVAPEAGGGSMSVTSSGSMKMRSGQTMGRQAKTESVTRKGGY